MLICTRSGKDCHSGMTSGDWYLAHNLELYRACPGNPSAYQGRGQRP